MYLRFAVTATLRYACMAMIVFHSLFLVVSLSVTLAQCRPLEKMWDLTGVAPGTCINTTAFFYCKPPEYPSQPLGPKHAPESPTPPPTPTPSMTPTNHLLPQSPPASTS